MREVAREEQLCSLVVQVEYQGQTAPPPPRHYISELLNLKL